MQGGLFGPAALHLLHLHLHLLHLHLLHHRVPEDADVLAAAVKWASCEGRAVATIDKVMPLVRFPLVSMLSPSDELKALKQRSDVVAALVKEALELQLTPNEVQAFTPAKHPLFDGVLTSAETPVPRAKKRKLNPNDKIIGCRCPKPPAPAALAPSAPPAPVASAAALAAVRLGSSRRGAEAAPAPKVKDGRRGRGAPRNARECARAPPSCRRRSRGPRGSPF